MLGVGLSVYQTAPQWNAWWGYQDDAEFLSWAPRGESLPLRSIPAALRQTEVVRMGRTLRFRPTYYVLHMLERSAWPPSPRWYYGVDTVAFAGALTLSAWALFLVLGTSLGFGIFALISTEWYWRDVWARLGPSEQYGFIGVSMLAIAAALSWARDRPESGKGLALLATCGTVLAMGAKENFLVLLAPLGLLLWHLSQWPGHRRVSYTLMALTTLGAITIAVAILPGLRAQGADMYGQLTGIEVRFLWVKSRLGAGLMAAVLILSALPWTAWRLLPQGQRTPATRLRLSVLTRRLCVQGALLLLLVVSQLVFYASTWPTHGGRYDFPGMLAVPLTVGALSVFLLGWLELAGAGAWLLRRLTYAITAAAVAMSLRHGTLGVRSAAVENVHRTQALHASMDSTVRLARGQGTSTPIIIEWMNSGDIEPAMTVLRLLYEVGSDGPFFMRPGPGARARGWSVAELARTGPVGDWIVPSTMLNWWRGVPLQPIEALPRALAASGGTGVVVTLQGYDVPMVRTTTDK